MAVQVTCPSCDFILDRETNDSPPSHCPSCNMRIACPRCGSTLQRHPTETAHYYCANCQARMDGTETGLLFQGLVAGPDFATALPGFELRGELGRGGMGIVYRAFQKSLAREVAIKVLPPALAINPRLMERFRNEAAVAAGLIDSHILPVFDVQESQGVPIIVMPLIEGRDLGKIVRDRIAVKQGRPAAGRHSWATLDDRAYLDKVMPILDQVVAAVTALHRSGVLHRDIKPSNVLVDRNDNVWLSDFGLARLEQKGVGTQPGLGLGTPGFTSPEQARGDAEIDFRADLFSLGATIYQVLSLEYPYGKAGTREVDAPLPVPPSRRQALVGRDFDAVVLMALEPDRKRRYASAAEMCDDWTRVRKGLLPKAQLAGPVDRLTRLVRRHPGEAFGGVAAAVALVLLAVVFIQRGQSGSDGGADSNAAVGPVKGTDSGSGVPGAQNAERNSPAKSAESDPIAGRTVILETKPPGARIVLVPLHQDNGHPLPDAAIRPKIGTIEIPDVPPGDYLIVAEVKGHGFHEVYRRVPLPYEVPLAGGPNGWTETTDGKVELPEIAIPRSERPESMVYLKGGEFNVGSPTVTFATPHVATIEPYYLDQTKVTVGAFCKILSRTGPDCFRRANRALPADSFPMTEVTYYEALRFAEKAGKRLPDELEYEFAATRGGAIRFPWGNDASLIERWEIRPVGDPAFAYDHTDGNLPILGLFSNALEWTTSWHAPYVSANPQVVLAINSPQMRRVLRGTRVVRGGPHEIVVGKPLANLQTPDLDPRHRPSYSADQAYSGIGFRCARSLKPRFLQDAKKTN